MHRPQNDWGGDKSPWAQLRTTFSDRCGSSTTRATTRRPRSLTSSSGSDRWASCWPPPRRRRALSSISSRNVTHDDQVMKPIAEKARVQVATKDVVEAQLLKQTIEVENFDSDPEALLDAAVARHKDLVRRARRRARRSTPKALYVVEESNPAPRRDHLPAGRYLGITCARRRSRPTRSPCTPRPRSCPTTPSA